MWQERWGYLTNRTLVENEKRDYSYSPSLPDTLTASHQTTNKLISCQHLQSNHQISNLALRIIQGGRKVSLF